MWRCYLFDTTSGVIADPIDLPNFSWTVNINTSTLCTTRDNQVGKADVTGLTVPWSVIPGTNAYQKSRSIAPLKTSIVLMWMDESKNEYPILCGAIGNRTDTWLDTSFDLISTLELLDSRYLVDEGSFGSNVITYKADNGCMVTARTTSSVIGYHGDSQRGIACSVIDKCTRQKPGGQLPIDLPYLGEMFYHYSSDGSLNQNYWRDYDGYDVANDSCKNILEKLSSTSYGPDMQFRPYKSDDTHIRVAFVAGSDSEPYLEQTGIIKTVTCFAGGGTLQNVSVDHDYPVQRVYGTGNGSEEKMNCWLAEDLSLVNKQDPWPLMEMSRQDTNLSGSTIAAYYNSILNLKKYPIIQIQGTINANDPNAPELGTFWPGELMNIEISDFPSLPDGTYATRLMEMGGNQSDSVKLLFDVMTDPIY